MSQRPQYRFEKSSQRLESLVDDTGDKLLVVSFALSSTSEKIGTDADCDSGGDHLVPYELTDQSNITEHLCLILDLGLVEVGAS